MKKAKKTDQKRRRIIQGAALSAAAIAAPNLAKAFCGPKAHAIKQASNTLDSISAFTTDKVSIELIESKVMLNNEALARVTVTNKHSRAIKLSHLSPGTIATQEGVYQINAVLQNNPIALRPNGVYQFWVKKDDGTQAKMSNKPFRFAGDGIEKSMLEVSVVTQTEAGPWVGTQRVQAYI